MLATDPVLDAILKPLAKHYASPEVVEMRMSRPKEITIEKRGFAKTQIEDESLRVSVIEHINMCLSNKLGLGFHPDDNPKISCVLPEGHRYECLVGSSVQSGLSLAIRCKHPFDAQYADYGLDERAAEMIKNAVIHGKHIIVSGGTNTGKTTFLNLMLKSLPRETRLVVLEDTPEIDFDRFTDSVGLIASRSGSTATMLGWESLYDHSNRITPKRIVFGEISVGNAFAAISILSSGVSSFLCSIHAESAQVALDYKFDQLIAMSGSRIPSMKNYLHDLVDMVVQIAQVGGYRQITEIYLPKENKYLLGGV